MVLNLSTIMSHTSDWLNTTSDSVKDLLDIDDLLDYAKSTDIDQKMEACQSLANLLIEMTGEDRECILQLRDSRTFLIRYNIVYNEYIGEYAEFYWVSYSLDETEHLSLFLRSTFDMASSNCFYTDECFDSTGRSASLPALVLCLLEQYATNNAVSGALKVLSTSMIPIDQLMTRLELMGYTITSEAKTIINLMYQVSRDFKEPGAILTIIKDMYSFVTSPHQEGNSFIFVRQGFTISSAATAIIKATIGPLVAIGATLATYAINPMLGMLTGAVSTIISGVSNAVQDATLGSFDPESQNCSAPLTLALYSKFTMPTNEIGLQIKELVSNDGCAIISDSFLNIYVTKLAENDALYQAIVIPECVATFENYDTGTSIDEVMGSSDETNPFVFKDPTVTGDALVKYYISNVPQQGEIYKMRNTMIKRPTNYLDAVRQACLTCSYLFYDLFGQPNGGVRYAENYVEGSTDYTVLDFTDMKKICDEDYLVGKSFYPVLADLRDVANKLLLIGSSDIKVGSAYGVRNLFLTWNDSLPGKNFFGLYQDSQWSRNTELEIDDLWNVLQSFNNILSYLLNGGLNSQMSFITLLNYVSSAQDSNPCYVTSDAILLNMYNKFAINPPTVSIASVRSAMAMMAVAAGVAAGIAIGAKAVMTKHILPKMNVKYNELQQLRNLYQSDDYIKDTPMQIRLRDQATLDRMTRKYNRKAKLLGMSTLSLTSGWENGNGTNSALGYVSPDDDLSDINNTDSLMSYAEGLIAATDPQYGKEQSSTSAYHIVDVLRIIKPDEAA